MRQILGSNLAQRIAAANVVGPAGLSTNRTGPCRLRFDDRRRGHIGRRLGRWHGRRIEQEGVFTQQPARLPVEFNEQTDKGVIDGLDAGQTDVGLPASLLNGHSHTGQCRRVAELGRLKGVRRSNGSGHRLGFVGGRIQFDLCPEWLSERTEYGNAAQAGGLCAERHCRDRGRNDGGPERGLLEGIQNRILALEQYRIANISLWIGRIKKVSTLSIIRKTLKRKENFLLRSASQ